MEDTRDKFFKMYGLCWLEFLHLKYWNPIRLSVINTMHDLFLREHHHHCVKVWGLAGLRDTSGAGHSKIHMPDRQKTQFEHILCALQSQSNSALAKIHHDYLVAVAELNQPVEWHTKACKLLHRPALG